MSGPKGFGSFPARTPERWGWGWSADLRGLGAGSMSGPKGFGPFPARTPKGWGWGGSADPRGLGAGSMSGPKDVWVWVLCCHESRGLGDGFVAGPNRDKVWVLPWLGLGVFALGLGFASGPKTIGFRRLTQQ